MKLLIQFGIIFGVCWVGEGLSQLLPLPGSVISMILLFLLLLTKLVKPAHIAEKSDFLLKRYGLFLYPGRGGHHGEPGDPLGEPYPLPHRLLCHYGDYLCRHGLHRPAGHLAAKPAFRQKGGKTAWLIGFPPPFSALP